MKTTIRRIARIIPVLGLALALVLPAAAASAGTYQYFGAESATAGASAFTQFNAASSNTLISIESNYVHCPAFNGAHVTWCGTVGNNTNHAQAGVNFTVNGVSHWMRMDVYAAVYYGHLVCKTRGDVVNFVTFCNGVGN
jgi:hypothetical protein